MNPYDSTVIAHSCVSPWRRRVLLVTAGGPVVVYLEVYDHEVPVVISPVMQATGWQIVHTLVWFRSQC